MIILDTCAFIYMAINIERLSQLAQKILVEEDLFVSDITYMEIGYLVKKGRLELPCGVADFIELVKEAHGVEDLKITPDIVEVAIAFSDKMNNDPADRIISATAVVNKCPLLTADKNLRKLNEVETLW